MKFEYHWTRFSTAGVEGRPYDGPFHAPEGEGWDIVQAITSPAHKHPTVVVLWRREVYTP